MEWIVLLIIVAAAVDWLSGGGSRSALNATSTRPRFQLGTPQPAIASDGSSCPTKKLAQNNPRRVDEDAGSSGVKVRELSCVDEERREDKRECQYHRVDQAAPKNPLVSTTQLGRAIGIKAKPILFEALIDLGYLERANGRYCLTALGRSVGGTYQKVASGADYVVWPCDFGTSLLRIKERLLDGIPFRLFHMTHIDNLQGVFAKGLHAHNFTPFYKDISNPAVNARRVRQDPVYNLSLHDYVPLYFNPRNAMLYEKQREYGDNIVILEISRSVCLQEYTLFTERNAAASKTRFEYCASSLAEFDWTRINCREWVHDRVTHVDEKQLMMSECLVREHIDTARIEAVHTMNIKSASVAGFVQNDGTRMPVRFSPDLFF